VFNPRFSRGFCEGMTCAVGGPPPGGPLVLPRALRIEGTDEAALRTLLEAVGSTVEELELAPVLVRTLIELAQLVPRLSRLVLSSPGSETLAALAHSTLHDRLRHLVLDEASPIPSSVLRGIARVDLGPQVHELDLGDATPDLGVAYAPLADELRAKGRTVRDWRWPARQLATSFDGDSPEDEKILRELQMRLAPPVAPSARDFLPTMNPMPPMRDFATTNPVRPFPYQGRPRFRVLYVVLALVAIALAIGISVWRLHR
jgi:hypothetical protein